MSEYSHDVIHGRIFAYGAFGKDKRISEHCLAGAKLWKLESHHVLIQVWCHSPISNEHEPWMDLPGRRAE